MGMRQRSAQGSPSVNEPASKRARPEAADADRESEPESTARRGWCGVCAAEVGFKGAKLSPMHVAGTKHRKNVLARLRTVSPKKAMEGGAGSDAGDDPAARRGWCAVCEAEVGTKRGKLSPMHVAGTKHRMNLALYDVDAATGGRVLRPDAPGTVWVVPPARQGAKARAPAQ
jgi:hypothetical protein